MVEDTAQLDMVFGSLADATRRDILARVIKAELSVGEIAAKYKMSFAAVAKHLQILEKAKLVVKRRQGREQIVSVSPATVRTAAEYLEQYEAMWNQRFDALEKLLMEEK